MYPMVCINREKLLKNVKKIIDLCSKHNIEITGITKCFAAEPKIAQIYVKGGLNILGDSRIINLKKLSSIQAEKWLIRPPMITEVDEVVKYADVSLNTELDTIKIINNVALKNGKTHKIILMIDLGDLREGYIYDEDLFNTVKEIEKLEAIQLYGIGSNLTCFSFVQPDHEKMRRLALLNKEINQRINRKLKIISGGNSATLKLMIKNEINNDINNFRLGESILFGRERANYSYLPDFYKDIFILYCEIVELKEKPSIPWGKIGVNSYGEKPTFINKGIRKKAICAIGKQDFDLKTSFPIDVDITILGASSDHLMIDVTDCKKTYKVGDIIKFRLGYLSTMRVFTSEYVRKVYS